MARGPNPGRRGEFAREETFEEEKVIALVDIDSFECQIWQREHPASRGKPCVVADGSGRLLSATYEAKAYGISREVRLPQAMKISVEKAFDLQVFRKPKEHQKPNTKTTRVASWDVLDTIKKFINSYAENVILEYHSSDEFFLDVSEEVERRLMLESNSYNANFGPRVFMEGQVGTYSADTLTRILKVDCPSNMKRYQTEAKLLHGALFIQELLKFMLDETQLEASAGIGTNKLMAKLGCEFNKPKAITIFLPSAFPRVSRNIKISNVPGLKGKIGDDAKKLFGINLLSELGEISFEDLEDAYGKEAERIWRLYSKSRGICDDDVKSKSLNNNVCCTKSLFSSLHVSKDREQFHIYVYNLANELLERLEEERIRHKRQPQNLKAHITFNRPSGKHGDCTVTMEYSRDRDPDRVAIDAMTAMEQHLKQSHLLNVWISKLGLSAKQFETVQ